MNSKSFNLFQKALTGSKNVLVISSVPVDQDCLGSGIAMKYWLTENYPKLNCTSVIFATIPESMQEYNIDGEISESRVDAINFSQYDIIIFLDGNAWGQLLSKKFENYLPNIDLSKAFLFDHHGEGQVDKDLGANSFRRAASCTAQVIYEELYKRTKTIVSEKVANAMYAALIDDTRSFKNELHDNMFLFAHELIKNGANHSKIVNTSISMDQLTFLKWALEHTEFDEKTHTSFLIIDEAADEELTDLFGSSWAVRQLDRYYKEHVLRIVDGFDYGLVFKKMRKSDVISVSWRARNYGDIQSVQEVLEAVGFTAGGHFGAGGGRIGHDDIHDISTRFKDEMKRTLT